MVIKRDPVHRVVPKADLVPDAVASVAEQGVQAPDSRDHTEPRDAEQVPERPVAEVPPTTVDRDAAVAALGDALGLGAGQGGGVAGSAAGQVPGASSFIASATSGLSGSKLANLTGQTGSGKVDVQAEMDQNPAGRSHAGQTTRDQLRERATSELIAQDPEELQSIAQQDTGAISDGGSSYKDWAWNTAKAIADRGEGRSATNPQGAFDPGEGVQMKGTGEWANEYDPAFHAVAGLITSNLQRGQAEIAAANGTGGAAPAGPVVEVRGGNIHTVHPDRRKTTTFGDTGTEVTKLKDGTVIIRRTDGSTTTQTPDGNITETPPKTTPKPSQPNEFQPVHLDLIGGEALEQQLAARRAAGSGDVTPTDDHEDLDFGAGAPPDLKGELLGGDRRVDDISGTGSGGSVPDLGRFGGNIDWGPDAVTASGSTLEQDRLGDTFLGDRPTLGIGDARRTDDTDDTDDADGDSTDDSADDA